MPEWEHQAAVAAACGATVRVAIPDAELAQWANQHLKLKHPGLTITEGKWGGTYGQVRADTVGGNVHHALSNEATEESKALGCAFWMTVLDHKQTGSYDGFPDSGNYRL